MSRRETFLASARAANDQRLHLGGLNATEQSAATLPEILSALTEVQRRLEAIEAGLGGQGKSETGRSRRGTLAWVLGAVLMTLLSITVLRPDWALRPRQRAELLLGERLYQRLQRMEERDRVEVLKSLWTVPSAAAPTTD